jgi:hypothetical protein
MTSRSDAADPVALWRLKLLLTAGLAAWIALPYFGLQHFHPWTPTLVPECGIEAHVPFTPAAAWLYLSLYLLVPLPALWMRDVADVWRYALGVGLLGLVSTVLFLFAPTAIVWPDAEGVTDPAYRLVRTADTPANACPSLHASLAVLAALTGSSLVARRARVGLWLWTAAVLYATLATRQHVVIDLVAGAALAIVVHRWTRRAV